MGAFIIDTKDSSNDNNHLPHSHTHSCGTETQGNIILFIQDNNQTNNHCYVSTLSSSTSLDSSIPPSPNKKRNSGRMFAGQILKCSTEDEIFVRLYQPVEKLLHEAGAPPPSTDEERLARLLAVATSTYYIRISRNQVFSDCEVIECPLAVQAALSFGQHPVLFKVGTCDKDGQLMWSTTSCGYLSSSSTLDSSKSQQPALTA